MADVASPPPRQPTPPQPTNGHDSTPPPTQLQPEPATRGMDTDPTPAAPAGGPDPAPEDPSASSSAPPPADSPKATKRPVDEVDMQDTADTEARQQQEEEQRAEKKRKLDEHKKENKARGNRMFGLMLGTLKRAKAQTSTATQTSAGRKRAEIEEKLQEKLGKERKEASEKEQNERDLRDLKGEIQRKEDEVVMKDSIYRTRHNAKLDLAGFLCTTFALPPPPPSSDLPPAFLPKLPHSMTLRDPRAPRPIYYLPRRLLPSQEDRIEDQIDQVKKEMRFEREGWEKERKGVREEVEELKRKREEVVERVERREREDRQRRRREAEEREDKERDRLREHRDEDESRARRERTGTREPSVSGMAVDEPGSATTPLATGETETVKEEQEGVDVDMDTNGGADKGDKAGDEQDPVQLSINGAASKGELAGEEELEY
ncbi:hypothetical protein JCM11641_003137 [Rhodosporidiobolus odoratus]